MTRAAAVVEYRVANIYPCGELAVHKAVRGNFQSRPPGKRYGPRMTRGMSPRGARQLRRAIVGKARAERCQFVMLGLTSQAVRSDEEMRRHLASLLAWGRKYLGPWFEWYVLVSEDHQRGVLHFHLLLAKRIPRPLFKRLRHLWAVVYGMGAGSVDIEPVRTGAKGAAKYLSKYLSKAPTHHRVGLDGEGMLTFTPWRVSRHNGQPHVRDRFRGNPYQMSSAARYLTKPTVTFWAPVGAFPGLDGYHGTHNFYDHAAAAEAVLAASLEAGPGPPGQRDASSVGAPSRAP